MRYIATFFITLYQKFISPLKGFRCAYGVLHGGHSCSDVIKNDIHTHGIFRAIPMAKEQFTACKEANEELKRNPKKRNRVCTRDNVCEVLYCLDFSSCSPSSNNSCDLPDGCDNPISCDSCGDCGDISCCDFG